MIINDDIRNEFDYPEDIIYFDNSATTQKPKQVIEEINKYYKNYCANSGRGSYQWATMVTKKVENTRKNVAKFLNCGKDEIFFTSGATHSSNMICYSYALSNLKDGDEVMLCYTDHKSTILPWLNIKQVLSNFGINIVLKEIFADVQGDYKESKLIDTVTEKTKIVVLTHIHNIYGIENNIEFLIGQIKEKNKNAIVVLDACQSAGHILINIEELKPDFLYFSGHKMYADTGVGVLYIKKDIQKYCKPFMTGGEFGGENPVSEDRLLNIINGEERKNFFECGTLNIPAILSLNSAIEFINRLDINEISIRLFELTRYLYEKLKQIKEIEFDKGIDKCSCQLGYGIISFSVEGISSSDLGDILSDYNVFVRTGKHCSTISNQDSVRVSLQIYNTTKEIDTFVNYLKQIINQSKM